MLGHWDMCLHLCDGGGTTTVAGCDNPSPWPEPKATVCATAAVLAASQSLATTIEKSRGPGHLDREATGCCVPHLAGYEAHCWNSSNKGNNHLSHRGVGARLDPKAIEWCGTDTYTGKIGCILTVVQLPLNQPLKWRTPMLIGTSDLYQWKGGRTCFSALGS